MKKDLILLHGALGASNQFQQLKSLLSAQFNCFTFNFSGHGGLPMPEKGFSIQKFSDDLLAFINSNNLEKPLVFGYSMGGYVALYLQRHHPDILGKIITLGTKWHWDPESAAAEAKMLNPDKIEEKVPVFAAQLTQRHQPQSWKMVVNNTAEMMVNMGYNPPLKDEDFEMIQSVVHITLGEKDKMVSISETEHVHHLLKHSTFQLLENTPHPIEQVLPDLLLQIITGQFTVAV